MRLHELQRYLCSHQRGYSLPLSSESLNDCKQFCINIGKRYVYFVINISHLVKHSFFITQNGWNFKKKYIHKLARYQKIGKLYVNFVIHLSHTVSFVSYQLFPNQVRSARPLNYWKMLTKNIDISSFVSFVFLLL